MDDPRGVPTYGLAEAAHYLHLPPSTLGNWVHGTSKFKRVIDIPEGQLRGRSQLSFINLVEAHMLATIRRKYRIQLKHIRPAIDYLQNELGHPHPLATMQIEADEVNLFIRHADKVLNISKRGQVAMREAIEAHLRRVKRAPDNTPLVLYPFVAGDYNDEREPVMFSPDVSFGQLVIAGTGIPTSAVAQRFGAGEKIKDLAYDFGVSEDLIEDAIRCEYPLAEAA